LRLRRANCTRARIYVIIINKHWSAAAVGSQAVSFDQHHFHRAMMWLPACVERNRAAEAAIRYVGVNRAAVDGCTRRREAGSLGRLNGASVERPTDNTPAAGDDGKPSK
jgi:hypothetical protein